MALIWGWLGRDVEEVYRDFMLKLPGSTEVVLTSMNACRDYPLVSLPTGLLVIVGSGFVLPGLLPRDDADPRYHRRRGVLLRLLSCACLLATLFVFLTVFRPFAVLFNGFR